MDIGHLIGISTHFIPMTYNETLEEIIDTIVKAGITAFELVPVEYQAQIGWPYNIPNVGLWFRDMNNQEIQKLKDNLSVFDIVTIHGQHLELNIASSNKGIREESYRQYLECLELARKLDVETVTYHTGHQTRGFIRDIQEIIKYNVYYGKKLANHAREHGIRIGYETGSISMLDKIFSHFKPDELGVNIDLGHTAMQRIDPETVIEKWKDRIVEIHFNGVNHYWGGFMEHQPIWMNNTINYRTVIPRIRDVGFRGPIICELQGNDIDQCIKHVLEAKELITFLWNRDDEIPLDIKPWRILEYIRKLEKK